MATGAVGYTHKLVEYVVSQAEKKELVSRQLSDPETDVLTGLPFLDEKDEALTKTRKIDAAKQYIQDADEEKLADLYVEYMSVPEDDYIDEQLDEQLKDMTRKDIEDMVLEYYPGYSSFLKEMDDTLLPLKTRTPLPTRSKTIMKPCQRRIRSSIRIFPMKNMYSYLSDRELAADFELLSLEDDDYIWLYDNAMPPVYSESTLHKNLKSLGYVDLKTPSVINIYASSFEDKDAIADAIKDYNETVPDTLLPLKTRTPLPTRSKTIMKPCQRRIRSSIRILLHC